MSGWTTIWAAIATAGAGVGTWLVTPKGPNQVLIRSSIALTLTCCYLMWFVIYMAQLHPLIKPKRADLRAE